MRMIYNLIFTILCNDDGIGMYCLVVIGFLYRGWAPSCLHLSIYLSYLT